jgi:hypothetical protein
MTPNEIKADNIARGFFCGDCDCAEDSPECEEFCTVLRDEILMALDAKDARFYRAQAKVNG